MAASWMMMLVMLLGDGGNHLLDYASTQEYWKTRGIAVNADAMIAELRVSETDDMAKLVVELASPLPDVRQAASRKILLIGPAALPQLQKAAEVRDPEISGTAKRLMADISAGAKKEQVRRLMAIRALGELGHKDGLPILRALADSKEMFIGEYARRAIAAIEGRPFERPAIPADVRKVDVSLMPAGVRALVQSEIPGKTNASTLEQLVEAVGALPGMNKQAMLAEMTSAIISIAEQTGDVRIDAITAGLSGDIGDNRGFATVIVRGEYDPIAVKALLEQFGMKKQTVEGMEFHTPAPQFAILFADNGRAVAAMGPRFEALPVAQLVKAVKAGGGELTQEKEMAGLLTQADMTLPLWGVMRVTEAFKQAAALAPFDAVTLAGRRSGQKLDVTLTGQGTDAAGVKAAVDMINASVQQILPNLKPAVQQMPSVKPMVDTLESLKASASGNQATLTLTMENDVGLMMPLMWFGVRTQPAPPKAAP